MGVSMSRISQLDAELSRLRRRAARQKQTRGGSSAAWQQWSGTMNDTADVIDQIVASPALDITSLAAKFRAILWQIEVNESLLDHSDLRRLKRFGRDLRLVAGKL
jgi:hypothetical protein